MRKEEEKEEGKGEGKKAERSKGVRERGRRERRKKKGGTKERQGNVALTSLQVQSAYTPNCQLDSFSLQFK